MLAAPAPFNTVDLQRWQHCARRFWRHRHATSALEAGPGPDIGCAGAAAALRASFPGAPCLPQPTTPEAWAAAQRATAAWLAAGPQLREGDALLGACLASDDGARVRIDVLWRRARGLRMFKLRWAAVGDDADVDAVALWAHVAARCGVRIEAWGLLLVDTDFVYPGHGCYAGILREVDLSPVLGRRPAAAWLVSMRRCERSPEPAVPPGPHCSMPTACEFSTTCGLPPAPQPGRARSLALVGRELAAALQSEGHADLLQVPEQRLADARHRRVWRALRHDAPVLEPGVAAAMRALPWPRHLLRIDAFSPAVPLWAGTRPYQVLPFQWTCERQHADGHATQQRFLAEAGNDPRRAFANALLQVVGARGAVLAYNAGFERNRLRELARHCEDLAAPLEALQARLVDLLAIARDHWYHPGLGGSWSFRAMARAVLPGLAEVDFASLGASSAHEAFGQSLQAGPAAPGRQPLRAAVADHGRREVAVLRALAALFDGADAPGADASPSK
jgi:hypothetical protein